MKLISHEGPEKFTGSRKCAAGWAFVCRTNAIAFGGELPDGRRTTTDRTGNERPTFALLVQPHVTERPDDQGRQFVTRPVAGAFTLIELLVVISIIALLAAMLVPAMALGKAQAQSASCKNHLRQMGLALKMYSTDCGVYPYSIEYFASGKLVLWMQELEQYYPLSWDPIVTSIQ